MRDLESMQEREMLQQQVLEDIDTALHHATRDDDDYRSKFRLLAICILYNLDPQFPISSDYDLSRLYSGVVKRRIEAFTTDDQERKYLLARVARKVLEVGLDNFRADFVHQELIAA